MVGTETHDLMDQLRDRLAGRAWLLDDGASYRAGVEDTLDELRLVLDLNQLPFGSSDRRDGDIASRRRA